MLERLQEVLVEFHRLRVAAGASSDCSVSRRRWSMGSVSSLYAVPSFDAPRHQIPLRGHTGDGGVGRVSGDIDVGKLV